MYFLVRVVVTALALWLTSLLLSSRVDILDNGTTLGTILALTVLALVFNLVHAIIKPIIKTLAFPIFILTLGLIAIFLNTFLLWIVTWVSRSGPFATQNWGLEIHGGFWWYFLTALIIALFQMILNLFAPKKARA